MVRKLWPAFILVSTLAVSFPGVVAAQHTKVPPGLAKKGGVPPGQAKRGCLPPGLAKKLGSRPPCRVYAAVDPEHTDRIWFLVDGRWVLKTNLELGARRELKATLQLDLPAPPPPPVPPPKVQARLTVLLFSD